MLEAIWVSPENSFVKPNDPLVNALADGLQSGLVNRHEQKNITFSIFEFKILSAEKIKQYRYQLFCPECLQVAYFKRASKDGKQACFGSRYHLPDCSELTRPSKNTAHDQAHSQDKIVNQAAFDEESIIEDKIVQGSIDSNEQSIKAIKAQSKTEIINTQDQQNIIELEDGFRISFSSSIGKVKDKSKTKPSNSTDIHDQEVPFSKIEASEGKKSSNGITQTLPKLLKSLFKNSSLATSDVWVYTSEKHKWRAKNLFVKFADAEVLEKSAPRLYWGTINNADKKLLWLNVAEAKDVAIPVKLFQKDILDKYSIDKASDLAGAQIILFAKCLPNKSGTRKFLQLWSNDLQYLHIALPAV